MKTIKSILFIDRARTSDRMDILTSEKLSENQETTPEGFLLCRNVPIARIGEQLYTADEIGLEARGDGLVKIVRDPDQVFRDETIASFIGKPVTIDHPDGTDVNPENWKKLTVGIVQNVRRGEGIEDDLLLADLLITDQEGIEAVRGGLKEVSCGYDADYVQIDAGLGRQENIIGNHVALVKRGRAGARCSIRDKDIEIMKTKAKTTWFDKLRKFLDAEEEAMKEEMKTDDSEEEMMAEEKETKDEGGDMDARLSALESGHTQILQMLGELKQAMAPTGDADEEAEEEAEEEVKTDDAYDDVKAAESEPDAVGKTFGDSMRDVIARAEILSPGIKVPSGDAQKAKGAKENLMRKALGAALENPNIKDMVQPLLLGRSLGKLTGDSLNIAFNGASELIKAHNNAKGVRAGVSTKDFGKTVSIAQINAKNREFYK